MKTESLNEKKELSQTTATTEEESPIEKFYRIKKEIDTIETDIQYYNSNVNTINTERIL
jgi:uncharacterized protein (UPF0335 family)